MEKGRIKKYLERIYFIILFLIIFLILVLTIYSFIINPEGSHLLIFILIVSLIGISFGIIFLVMNIILLFLFRKKLYILISIVNIIWILFSINSIYEFYRWIYSFLIFLD